MADVTPTGRIRIALAQLTGEPYAVEANRALSLRAARRGFSSGADLVVLPELIIPGYAADRKRLREVAEAADGPSTTAWCQVAAEGAGYIAGGFCERDGDKLYNTAVVVGPDGILLHYRKLHPFGAEKLAFEPGDLGLPVADLSFGRVGTCVCYDLRFVETLRALSLQGADLVCVPTAWVAGFDRDGGDRGGIVAQMTASPGIAPQALGVAVQANLDQVFVACASQAGRRDGLEFLGSSVLAGPTGELIAGPLSRDVDDLIVAEVDLADAERAQRRAELITPRADRRTDVYGVVLGGRVL